MADLPRIALGREVTGSFDAATAREWLLTDGTGSYAMGTVALARTRRYHGLLIIATRPPVGRFLCVGGMTEQVSTPWGPDRYLGAQRWAGGEVDPRGHELIEEVRLDGGLPTWRIAIDGGAILERRIWMPRRSRRTVVGYRLAESPAGGAVTLRLGPQCTWRDHHADTQAGAAPEVVAGAGGLRIRYPQGEITVHCAAPASVSAQGAWHRAFLLEEEWERGLQAVEDLYCAGTIELRLRPGEEVLVDIAARAQGDPGSVDTGDGSLAAERERRRCLLECARLDGEPDWVRQLALAADDFVVAREGGHTVIAGYPWFTDWGRDTMIALPGLTAETGRPDVGEGLLRTFAAHVDRGLIPNRFPDLGEQPEYNTVDATLWYIEALRAHVADTGDEALVDELWPVLEEIVRWHVHGTRHGIGVDTADGLLRAGEPGGNLTWMDARVGDRVVTPRSGKPVEVNALWYNALSVLAGWSQGRATRHDHASMAARVRASFDRYWDPASGHLRDVIDGPAGDEIGLRPNQLLAVSLTHSPLAPEQARAVVVACLRALRTSMGPRTLAPGEPGYAGRYGGGVRERDAAYHQGTAWPWLLGPLVSAHLRVFGDAAAARALLAPMEHHLRAAGLGSISEIADGEPPHAPRGCPWQAWSVAEVLRAWRECSRFQQAAADRGGPAVPSAAAPLVTTSGETRA